MIQDDPLPFKPKATSPQDPARYRVVMDHIRDQIQRGVFRASERIPSEHEWMEHFKLSRMTIHRALRELAAEGLIHRINGVGTFVSAPRHHSSLLKVVDIQEEIRGRGGCYTQRLIGKVKEPANAWVAEQLTLKRESEVFHYRCVHLENGVPLQLEDRYVNPALAPHFLEAAFETAAAYLLQEVPLDWIEHSVEAFAADMDTAAHLGIPPGTACLVLERRTWCKAGVVTWVRCTHPGHGYRLGERFRPKDWPGAG